MQDPNVVNNSDHVYYVYTPNGWTRILSESDQNTSSAIQSYGSYIGERSENSSETYEENHHRDTVSEAVYDVMQPFQPFGGHKGEYENVDQSDRNWIYLTFPALDEKFKHKNENRDVTGKYDEPDLFPNNIYQSLNVDKQSQLVTQLIALCPNKMEKHPEQTAKLFFEMGKIFRAKSPDKFSLIRAAGLFNAARTRNDELIEDSEQQLIELGDHIQYLADAHCREDFVAKALKITEKIHLMRKKAESTLNSLEKIPEKLQEDELQNHEKVKILLVENIQDNITEDYLDIMADLSEFCEHVMGNPPCLYAVVGMGSLARKEVTPYSDFEHVIVLEEGCQNLVDDYQQTLEYFRWYSVIFHVVVINLMETILPSLDIACLKDGSKNHPLFFDTFTKRGISFDGMMIHACKFPLGRREKTEKKPFTTELIKPVSEMLKYLSSDSHLKHGYHLDDILTKTCFVYGNKDVYKIFAHGVHEKLQADFEKGSFNELKLQLIEDLSKFAIGSNTLSALKSSDDFNVKRLVYRTTTLFISAWGRLEGIHNSSPFDIISALCDKKIISTNQGHKLMYAVALACEIRLRVYLEKDRQDDNYLLGLYHESDNMIKSHPFIDVVGKTSLINYFQIAYTLQIAICKKINVMPSDFFSDPSVLNITISSALGLQNLTNTLVQAYISHPSVPEFN